MHPVHQPQRRPWKWTRRGNPLRPDGSRIATTEAIINRLFALVLLCTLLLVVLAFTTACGHSNRIGTCLACPEEQAVYATTNSGQVLTFPFPLGTQLGTPISTAGPANSGSPFAATMPSGDILFVEGELFLPDASSVAIGGFVPDLSNGVVSPVPGSPFPAGSGPLALAYSAFPLLDPP
jgi:hypothetical protein